MTTRAAMLLGALVLLAAEAVAAVSVFAVVGSGILDPDRGPRDTAVQYLSAWGALGTRSTWSMFPACYQAKTSYAAFAKTQDAEVSSDRRIPANITFRAVAVRADGRYRRVEVEFAGVPSPFGNTIEVVVTDQYGDGWKVVDFGAPEHQIRDRCAGGVR